MYYLLQIIYKPSENNYKQVRNLRSLLEKNRSVTTVGQKIVTGS